MSSPFPGLWRLPPAQPAPRRGPSLRRACPRGHAAFSAFPSASSSAHAEGARDATGPPGEPGGVPPLQVLTSVTEVLLPRQVTHSSGRRRPRGSHAATCRRVLSGSTRRGRAVSRSPSLFLPRLLRPLPVRVGAPTLLRGNRPRAGEGPASRGWEACLSPSPSSSPPRGPLHPASCRAPPPAEA